MIRVKDLEMGRLFEAIWSESNATITRGEDGRTGRMSEWCGVGGAGPAVVGF